MKITLAYEERHFDVAGLIANLEIQGVLGLHEFWAREKIVQAKFVLVKLCTCSFVKLRASEILSTCYPRNGLYLKNRASEIRASQGPPVLQKSNSYLN